MIGAMEGNVKLPVSKNQFILDRGKTGPVKGDDRYCYETTS